MYALKFRPILKTVVWGGEKIAPYKEVVTDQHNVGESWELSGVKGHESVIANGEFEGMTITVKAYAIQADGFANADAEARQNPADFLVGIGAVAGHDQRGQAVHHQPQASEIEVRLLGSHVVNPHQRRPDQLL